MRSAASLARLQAIGIEVWLRRDATPAGAAAALTASSATDQAAARIRLESGSGRWLLVADEAERVAHRRLLDDLRALLDPAECRFGKWSDSPEAGAGPDDWAAHGIEHVLAFGAVPASARGVVLEAPELKRLESDADARRTLWALLRPHLGA